MKKLNLTVTQWRHLDEARYRGPQYPMGPASLRVYRTLATKGLCYEVVIDGLTCYGITGDGDAALRSRELYLSDRAVKILRKLAEHGSYAIPKRKFMRMSPAEREIVSGGYAERLTRDTLAVTARGIERAATLEKTP